MIIKSLKLKNYRNYDLLNLEFDEHTNIFYGDNAQGKTNILESVYLTGTTKSHRGTKDRDLIKFGHEESHIETIVEKRGVPFKIDIHLKKNSPKGIAINKIPIKRASELFGIINIVFFSPEDLNIIKDGPSERRRFLDTALCQLKPSYAEHLSGFRRALLQRNALLKDLHLSPQLYDMLDSWDEQLARYSAAVISERLKYIEILSQYSKQIYAGISENKESFSVTYSRNDISDINI
jgi:DNA replication and repair protein RecF